jgi:hypothetical protein
VGTCDAGLEIMYSYNFVKCPWIFYLAFEVPNHPVPNGYRFPLSWIGARVDTRQLQISTCRSLIVAGEDLDLKGR